MPIRRLTATLTATVSSQRRAEPWPEPGAYPPARRGRKSSSWPRCQRLGAPRTTRCSCNGRRTAYSCRMRRSLPKQRTSATNSPPESAASSTKLAAPRPSAIWQYIVASQRPSPDNSHRPTAQNASTVSVNLGYRRPEKRKVGGRARGVAGRVSQNDCPKWSRASGYRRFRTIPFPVSMTVTRRRLVVLNPRLRRCRRGRRDGP